MLLKVMIYCYMTGIYSSRQIAKQCRENVNVMWLTGFQKPDFRTAFVQNQFKTYKPNLISDMWKYAQSGGFVVM